MLIKSIRKYFLNAFVGIPLLFVFTVTSYSSFANSLEVEKAHYFSGEEIFKGIFFLEGKYCEMIPELASLQQYEIYKQMTPQQKLDFEKEKKKVINFIQKKNPEFFVNFKLDIKSGDRLRIEQSFKDASSLIVESIRKVNGLSEKGLDDLKSKALEFKSSMINEEANLDDVKNHILSNSELNDIANAKGLSCTTVLVCAAYLALAVAAWLVMSVTTYVTFTSEDTTGIDSKSSLFKEQLINSVCETSTLIA